MVYLPTLTTKINHYWIHYTWMVWELLWDFLPKLEDEDVFAQVIHQIWAIVGETSWNISRSIYAFCHWYVHFDILICYTFTGTYTYTLGDIGSRMGLYMGWGGDGIYPRSPSHCSRFDPLSKVLTLPSHVDNCDQGASSSTWWISEQVKLLVVFKDILS